MAHEGARNVVTARVHGSETGTLTRETNVLPNGIGGTEIVGVDGLDPNRYHDFMVIPPNARTVEQAAEQLGASTQMVLRWIRDKQLAAERVGTMYLIDPRDITRFRRPRPGRPIGVWFLPYERATVWHCTQRMSANENGISLCGKSFDLSGTAHIDRAGKPVLRGSESLCASCALTWGTLQRRLMHAR